MTDSAYGFLCSGVTVGGGVDLGSKSRSLFRRIGVCSPLIDRLEPYFGHQGRAADTYLQQNPLTLTDSEASYLTDLVMQHNVQSVESRYNAVIGAFTLSLFYCNCMNNCAIHWRIQR